MNHSDPIVIQMYNENGSIKSLSKSRMDDLDYAFFVLPSDFRALFSLGFYQTPIFAIALQYPGPIVQSSIDTLKDNLSCIPEISGPIIVEVDFRKNPHLRDRSDKSDLSWGDVFYENEKFGRDRIVLSDNKKFGFDAVEQFSPMNGGLGSIDNAYIRYKKNTNTIDRLAICHINENGTICSIQMSLKSNSNITMKISKIDGSCSKHFLDIASDVDNMLSQYLLSTTKNSHQK